jgi:hypothetical protein
VDVSPPEPPDPRFDLLKEDVRVEVLDM